MFMVYNRHVNNDPLWTYELKVVENEPKNVVVDNSDVDESVLNTEDTEVGYKVVNVEIDRKLKYRDRKLVEDTKVIMNDENANENVDENVMNDKNDNDEKRNENWLLAARRKLKKINQNVNEDGMKTPVSRKKKKIYKLENLTKGLSGKKSRLKSCERKFNNVNAIRRLWERK